MVRFASHRYEGTAGGSNTERMNIEHRTPNIECRMEKDAETEIGSELLRIFYRKKKN